MANEMAAKCPLCASADNKILLYRKRDGDWQLRRCQACGLHFTFPYPTLQDISRFYIGPYHHHLFDEGVSEREFGPKFERYTSSILAHFKPGHALDVGCTTGLFLKYLQNAGFQAEGLEVNPEAAEWGRQHYGVTIHVGTLEEFRSPADPYDFVSLADVVEHTLNPARTMQQVNQLLRMGGGAIVTFPDIKAVKSRYYRLMSKIFRRDEIWTTCWIPWHTWEFTEPIARRIFEQAGFEVVGYTRSETGDEKPPRPFRFLARPTFPLVRPYLASRFGTQMEFVLKKVR